VVDGKMLENDEDLLNLSALNYVVKKKFLIALTRAYHVVLFLLLQFQLQ